MATAKQIAARKRFAEMAKSGKLATMRKRAAKKPAGKPAKREASVKSNPAPKNKVQTKRGGCNPDYLVQIKKGRQWVTVGSHGSQVSAEEAAQTLHKSGVTVPIRVWG